MKRQGAAPPPCLSGSAPLGKVPPHLTPRALLIRARPVPLPHPETADAKRTFGLWDKWPDAIPTATCLLRCRSGRRSGFPARRACRAEGSFAAEPDHERPRGRGSKKPLPKPKPSLKTVNMVAVSLTGQVHVNLAVFAANGIIYPWICSGLETPDLRVNTHDMLQNVSYFVVS
ncbi:MAG: hypothetical protein RL472_1801 [Pseudomonadota bacterium]